MKHKMIIALFSLLLTVHTAALAATPAEKPRKEKIADMTDAQKEARIAAIKSRVEEIKATDKSTLSRSEKKALKKELKQLNKEAREVRGVYLSVGAIIIIILLLILIL